MQQAARNHSPQNRQNKSPTLLHYTLVIKSSLLESVVSSWLTVSGMRVAQVWFLLCSCEHLIPAGLHEAKKTPKHCQPHIPEGQAPTHHPATNPRPFLVHSRPPKISSLPGVGGWGMLTLKSGCLEGDFRSAWRLHSDNVPPLKVCPGYRPYINHHLRDAMEFPKRMTNDICSICHERALLH